MYHPNPKPGDIWEWCGERRLLLIHWACEYDWKCLDLHNGKFAYWVMDVNDPEEQADWSRLA